MSAARTRRRLAAAGFTMVELVVAAGLMTIVIVTLLTLIDDFIALWDKSELRRQGIEQASGAAELLAADLAALDPGPRGDLLAEWAFFDTDGDNVAESKWPRLRLVRYASPRELALMQAGRETREAGEGLIEVYWGVLPARARAVDPDLRAEGWLWRGERLVGSAQGPSFFDDDFLSTTGRPAPGAIEEVGGGVLWLGMAFATQTSTLDGAWKLGEGLEDCRAGWDAWKRGRANAERHVWNEFEGGLVRVVDTPLLPRRVRIELEIERRKDLKRRTRVARLLEPEEGTLIVDDGTRVPDGPDAHVLVGTEWMRVLGVSGDRVQVARGARGTRPQLHERGALVHHGLRLVREVPIGVQREDWDL